MYIPGALATRLFPRRLARIAEDAAWNAMIVVVALSRDLEPTFSLSHFSRRLRIH